MCGGQLCLTREGEKNVEKKKDPYIKPQLKLIPLGSREYDQYIYSYCAVKERLEENDTSALPVVQLEKNSPKKQSDG